MFEIVQSGGWMMLPIISCSILALAIIAERFITLRASRIAPEELTSQVQHRSMNKQVDDAYIKELQGNSPLGRILAAGIVNRNKSVEAMKESMNEVASVEIHSMERFISGLGTIAAVTPLMGLLGTVLGMIKVFNQMLNNGLGEANMLAGGISEALISTAGGLLVAIPALIMYRMLQRKIDDLVVKMEQQSGLLVDALHADKRH